MEHWQDARGNPKHLGTIWVLTKKGREARCELYGHQFGSEARALVDGDLRQSEVFRDSRRMVDVTMDWRKAYEDKGWATR